MPDENKNWLQTVKSNIETISEEKINAKEVRFYNLGGFIDISQRVSEFADNCETCNSYKSEISEISENIDKYINTSVKTKKDFEKKRDKYSEHLKKEHGLVKKNSMAATYAFIGLLIGALVGYLFAKIFLMFADAPENFTKVSVLIAWALGLITGRVLGTLKDKQIKKENRFY